MEKKNEHEKIYHDGELIASIIRPLLSKDGLSFYTDDENFMQVGVWNYEKGKTLPAHYHNEFGREAFKTNEAVIVLKGKIECSLYTEDGDLIKKVTVCKNEMIVQFNGAHEYLINEDSIVV